MRSSACWNHCDILIVVGSTTSSNSNRLRELADRAGMPGYLVDGPDDLQRAWFAGRRAAGVTAGASAPEVLVQEVVAEAARVGRLAATGNRRSRGERGVQPAAQPSRRRAVPEFPEA